VNIIKEYFQILVDTLLVHRIDGKHSTSSQSLRTNLNFLLVEYFHVQATQYTWPRQKFKFFANLDYFFNAYSFVFCHSSDFVSVLNNYPDIQDLKILLNFKKEYPNSNYYCLTSGDSIYKKDAVTVIPWRQGINEILNNK
jgi:hypothetical protein